MDIDLLLCVCGEILAFLKGVFCWQQRPTAPFYGSGIKIAPDAIVDDGMLDVCIVADVSRRTVLRMFLSAYSGAHIGHSAVRIVQTRTLQIESDDPLWIFADGEPVCEIPTKIEIVPGALKVKTQ